MSKRIGLSNVLRGSLVVATAVLGIAGAAAAADSPAKVPGTISKEAREKMAVLHEQMAACLRSDRPIADCRSEMRKSCMDAVGEQGCPMMGMGTGKHHHGHSSSESTPK